MEKGILLSEQERVAFKMISTGNDLHGKRATALLAIDEGASQAQAAQLSGLTPGQVKYWLGKFRDVRMEIFPETILESEQTQPAQDQTAEEPAAVEPLDKTKKPEPAKSKQKSKSKKGKKSKAKKGKGKKKKKKKKKGSGKKGTKK